MKLQYMYCIIFLMTFFQIISEEKTVYTLDDCIRAAENNNPHILALRDEVSIAESSYKIAKAANRPTLSGSITTNQINNEDIADDEIPIPGRDTKYGIITGLGAGYNIYKPGRQETISNSRRALEISRIQGNNVYKETILSVKSAYYNYVILQKELMLKKASLQRYTIIYKKMQIYAGAGQTSSVELSNWEVVLSNANLDYEKSLQSVQDARSQLFLVMGIEDNDPSEIELVEVKDLPAIQKDIEELQLLALNYSPELIKAQINEEISKSNVEIAKDQRHPSLNAFANLGYQNDVITDSSVPVEERLNSEYWYPGFVVGLNSSLPIYTGGSIPANIDKSKAEYNKSRYATKNTLLTIKSQVKNMYNQLGFLTKQIEISKKKIITSRSNLRIVERNYESGISKPEDVLNATENLYNAEMDYISAKVEYVLLVSKLANLIGVEEEYICQN